MPPEFGPISNDLGLSSTLNQIDLECPSGIIERDPNHEVVFGDEVVDEKVGEVIVETEEDVDDEEDDTKAEAEKVWSMGKLMSFEAENDMDLTKALVRIKTRKKQ